MGGNKTHHIMMMRCSDIRSALVLPRRFSGCRQCRPGQHFVVLGESEKVAARKIVKALRCWRNPKNIEGQHEDWRIRLEFTRSLILVTICIIDRRGRFKIIRALRSMMKGPQFLIVGTQRVAALGTIQGR